jgi:hypothetical protein
MIHNLAYILSVSDAVYTVSHQMHQQGWDYEYAKSYLHDQLKRDSKGYVVPTKETLERITAGQIISYQFCGIPNPLVSSDSLFHYNLELYLSSIVTKCAMSLNAKHIGNLNYTLNTTEISSETKHNVYHLRACYLLRSGYGLSVGDDALIITDPVGRTMLYTAEVCSCSDYVYTNQCAHLDLIRFYQRNRRLFND